MSKLTLDTLRSLRLRSQADLAMRTPADGKAQIIVGMGTCGIAAGAKDTLSAITDALHLKGMTDARVRQTGCMGFCHSEPTVEVLVPGMPGVIYGRVDPAIGRQIVEEHIIGRKLLANHICDRPAMDIVS
jgi:NADP-reducing hydrogenase subunit HndB